MNDNDTGSVPGFLAKTKQYFLFLLSSSIITVFSLYTTRQKRFNEFS